MKKVTTQPTFEKFKLVELQVPPSRPKSTKGFPFEFELGKSLDYLQKDMEILWHRQVHQSLWRR